MTTAPVIDERTHRAVVEALVAAAVGEGRVYDYGKVPGADGNDGTLPPIYVLLSVERRYVEPRRAGLVGRSGWRVVVRCVGRTPNETRWALAKATQALEERRLTVGGFTSTPVALESSQDVEPDDGRFSGLRIWTYAL